MASDDNAPPSADVVAARARSLELHRIAVEESKARYKELRLLHRQIADHIANLSAKEVAEIVSRATRIVEVWEAHLVPSPYYAKAWRTILEDPAPRIRKMLRGAQANALVQNSPLAFLYRTQTE